MKEVILADGLRVMIRPQALEDVHGLWQLYSSLSRRTRTLAGIQEQTSKSRFEERMTEVVRSKNLHRFICVVPWQGIKRLIGYFGMDVKEDDPTVAWIFLFVHDEYQGKGLGKGILNFIIEEAPSLGLKTLRLQVYADNKHAMKLFDRFGFKREKGWLDPQTRKRSYVMVRLL